jgi:translation initiation factor 2 beta subunit (eIF-2beta)/eIF-5
LIDSEHEQYLSSGQIILLINSAPINCKILKSESDNTILSVSSSKPISFDEFNISVLGKFSQNSSTELFAYGQIIGVIKHAIRILPDEINDLYDQLLTYEPIEIIDDISDRVFDTQINIHSYDEQTLREQITEIKQEIRVESNFKMSIPKLEIMLEPTRHIWTNAQVIINKFDLANSKLKIKIDVSKIKWRPFQDNIIDYLNYIYKKEDAGSSKGTSINAEGYIIIHVKSNTKKKPSVAILDFINQYYVCSICQAVSARIGKINTQMMSICVLCNNRKNITNW